MEIKTNSLNELNIESTGKVSNMKLDEESHAMIFQMFTGGLYSDPIGTVVREITSNCFDSHIEAGVDSAKNPVIVELTKEVSGNFIIFRDKGVGMSPDRVENIYGTYFKSTKRTSNDQIGGFGIGGKTPLAYTESFYIITRFEGVEYTYNVFEGNEVPAVELLGQQSTKEPNGTDVKVPVKEFDVQEFEQKTLRQLYYFENIVFKGFSDRYVTNDYSIVKGKSFLYRGSDYSNKMHVCYGKVAYPIDYDAMGLSPYDYEIPVAVRIEIGELEGTGVTPSREAIKYTKATIKTIKTKMDEVVEELKGLISEQYTNVESLKDYYRAKDDFGTLYFDDNRTLYVGGLIKQNDVTYPNFRFNDLFIPRQSEIVKMFYDIKLYGKKYSTRSWKNTGWNESLKTMKDFENIYYVDGEFNRKVVKQSYLRTLVKSENFYVLIPKDLNDSDVAKSIKRSLGALQMEDDDNLFSDEVKDKVVIPTKVAEKLIRTLYAELYEIIKEGSVGSYDDVEVPDSFIQARKQARLSDEILKTTIPVKNVQYSSRDRVTLKDLQSLKGRIYYGFNDDSYTLQNACTTFRTLCENGRDKIASTWEIRHGEGKGTMFISISKGNEKYMKMLDRKAIHVDYFYETFVSRKIDKIIQAKLNKRIKTMFSEEVSDMFKNETFKHVDENVYNLSMMIKELTNKVDSEYAWNVNAHNIEMKLGINIESIDAKFTMQKELDYLVKLTNKNKNRLKWFDMPYTLDLEREDHKELVSMIDLMFER